MRTADKRARRAEQMAGQILEIARRDGLEPGDRLVEQRLADTLGVSRGPVRSALLLLAKSGVIAGQPNRGYVLAKSTTSRPAKFALAAAGESDRYYRAIAEDRLDGALPEIVTEAELMRRYSLGRPEIQRLLDRIAAEGWIARLPGYGWRFAETLSSAEAYGQAAEFRAVIEPAALAEPGYRLGAATIETLRDRQCRILDGGLETLTMGEIFQAGCEFHEEIARGAGNPFYVEALRRVNSIRRLFAYRTFADHDGIRRHIHEHLRLLDLIGAGRRGDAAELMRAHLRNSPRARTRRRREQPGG
jgi:DNA-binding GntR family transcriptional regulator